MSAPIKVESFCSTAIKNTHWVGNWIHNFFFVEVINMLYKRNNELTNKMQCPLAFTVQAWRNRIGPTMTMGRVPHQKTQNGRRIPGLAVSHTVA